MWIGVLAGALVPVIGMLVLGIVALARHQKAEPIARECWWMHSGAGRIFLVTFGVLAGLLVLSMFLLHKEALKRRRIDELWRHRAATEPGALLDVILSEAMLDELRKEVRRKTGITTTAQALSEVIRTEIVDPKLLAKRFKA